MDFYYKRSYRGPLKAVVLDWAGTTMDYGCFAPSVVFNKVFEKRGVNITTEQAREPMGMAKKDHIRAITQMDPVIKSWIDAHGQAPTEADVESMYEEFIPMQLDVLAQYAELIPGTVEAIAEIRKRGMKVGTSTGYNQEMMDICIEEGKKKGYNPDYNVCASDVPAGRPSPHMCFVNLINLNVFPVEACVKIGDTPADIYEGLNAGMWTIGTAMSGNEMGMTLEQIQSLSVTELAPKKNRAYQRLAQSGAHYVVDSITDVPNVLDEIASLVSQGEKP